ncbi:hypothetical protein EHQ58_00660 [Leptospira ognonensis]|uniref:Uncharacterized protein n=1 Tax=Leptospira ognonensis TaxID=2484945 RepID=A0A4R9KAZ9_9LEPT|nr:hypothetical protein [Leptospira ognonensis]TGL63908.1 hypothetical protein EHQ58_00660 [Leptospira ognonensis]
MELILNDSEVKHLLEAIVVYEWIANSPHEESDPSVDTFCQSLLSKLKNSPVKDSINQTSDGTLSVNETLFQQIHDDYIEAYNDDLFWSDLAFELGTRDLSKKYTEVEFQKLSEEEREKKAAIEIENYDKEFESYGIERLYLKK